MNKKTRAKINASLEEAMKPLGGKEFILLPKDSNLSRRELMDMLLENYSDNKYGHENIKNTNPYQEEQKTENCTGNTTG